jgi:hypothetical protein
MEVDFHAKPQILQESYRNSHGFGLRLSGIVFH